MGLCGADSEGRIGITYDHDGRDGVPGVLSDFQLLYSLGHHGAIRQGDVQSPFGEAPS